MSYYDEEELAKTKRFLMWIVPMWAANLTLFCTSLFLAFYYKETSSWLCDPFIVLCWSFGISKAVLSVMLLIGISEHSKVCRAIKNEVL